jgi:hypothetical protein
MFKSHDYTQRVLTNFETRKKTTIRLANSRNFVVEGIGNPRE